ncbi:MAG: thioredoxin domain-containing protein [Gammaproteobacteria bacterium]|nr:thioredoxin domain-containing protein [Gammaproteobacteria bacterium]
MTAANCHTNRLSHETSPYLQQHAHNPVDWYPWGPEALERARREDKPILLSIGYSACHWCHVMAHESFEDPATAEVMNALFVNIKVDREERPDLDRIYQTAHHLLTRRSGGWPLTMMLAPDSHAPYFGGTYFPREARYGLPAFTDLLQRIARAWHEQRSDIEAQNQTLVAALAPAPPAAAKPALNAVPLAAARHQLESSFDAHHGGFGSAPKFPHPPHIERLLRHYAHSLMGEPDAEALRMATATLRAMAQGGIYDQIGGGFCRYAVDERWLIPHFEKMLYDNGLLLGLYAQAYALTREALFKDIALETARWAMREMQSSEGGYYSALDADSEGHEGKFYVWSRDEIRTVLDTQEYDIAARRFGLTQAANFEDSAWHLYAAADSATIAHELNLTEARAAEIIDSARRKLFTVREARVRPGRDEKILTSWNALMIKGMALAGRLLDAPECTASAERALDFIRATLWTNKRLLATYKDGRAHLPAYLDDHAFLLDALLEMLQTRWRTGDLQFAVEIADVMLEHFEDKQNGGFFFTADDHEQLIQRPRPLSDDATPSGNGIAALALGRLGHLLGEPRYLDAATRTLEAAWSEVARMPYAHGTLLSALEEQLHPPQIIVLRGDAAVLQPWRDLCNKYYAPRRLAFAIPAAEQNLPGVLAQQSPATGVTAYVCEGVSCSAPITDLSALEARLAARK